MSAAEIDAVFRTIDRPVWIVTAADGHRRGGLTATWVYQASLDAEAPVAVAGIAPGHFTAELIAASGFFAAHLLTPEQAPLALRFAISSGRETDKLAGLEHVLGLTGCPILSDCLAWLECKVFHAHSTGDRYFYWADVVAGESVSAALPLTERELFAAAGEDDKRRLKELLATDIAAQRPLRAAWRNALAGCLSAKGRADGPA